MHTHARRQTHTVLGSAGVWTNLSTTGLHLFSGRLGCSVNNEPAVLQQHIHIQSATCSIQRYIDGEIRTDSALHFTHLPLSSYLSICPLLFQCLSASVSVRLESRRQSRRGSVPEKTRVQRSVNISRTALKDHVQLDLSHTLTNWHQRGSKIKIRLCT